MLRSLPLDYPVRNLSRRPTQTLLTLVACALVAGVLVATVAFVQGLEKSFAGQGRGDTAILLSASSMRDIVRSAISPAAADLVAANVAGVHEENGVQAVSPEVHMGSNLRLGPVPPEGRDASREVVYPVFLRGVTERAFLVHENVTLVEGALPGPGEVLVGRLVGSKIGVPEHLLRVGATLRFEGGEFQVSGVFAAPGTTIESELWAPMQELMGHAQREDISAVFVRMTEADLVEDVEVFAGRRLDLSLLCVSSKDYYGAMAAYFVPIQTLAWIMALLISLTVVFTGANTLNMAVQDRMRELATLRTLGFSGFALVSSVFIEALLLASAGGLLGLLGSRLIVQGSAFRIAMGAFSLDVDGVAVLSGFGGVLVLGFFGTLPAALRVLRLPVAVALQDD